MGVQEETLQSAVEGRTGAGEDREASSRELRAAIEVEDAALGAEIPVGLGLEALSREIARDAPAATLGVLGFVFTHRSGRARDIGDASHEVVQLGVELGALRGEALDARVDLANGFLGRLGLFALAFAHQSADLLGQCVALTLKLLFMGDCATA